ncbi:beta-L-arabinofuranosidase domain-containing protein [Paenibacillus sp. MMS20-IR301]|uniref:glycoside hydrolase family 127 protein n=1 Tax=Paenibacillus sp. MMS20-IR301 TaxID=2895946 RepID=UPI0028F0FDD8|nr:beta-L-arabinofuranosidase domain-containing protein [Paenibacillus sp. MMS20-IR301]WNS45840.1 glycoside hydrolase family 127 protein [Paenibacillus sp. MMS20-IR301]
MSKTADQQQAAAAGQKVTVQDDFWGRYIRLVQDTVIPYQYEALHDRVPEAEPSHAIANFEIAAGRREGEFKGWVFQDSDVAKWLEAVGYSLSIKRDPELERQADEMIDLVGEAQYEDGYLNTYFTLKEPGKRWTNLMDCHELYCAGHFIEAAVAYYEATGKDKLLGIVCRFVDHIETVFGPEEGKLKGYDGHQEIELALVKLYRLTGEERYLKLSSFFIDQRGQEPNFLVQEWEQRGRVTHWTGTATDSIDPGYNQAHIPVREQSVALGHSVRAVYMYTAMADLALLTGDAGLREACERLWKNTTEKQMYITGGIGSTHHGEAFTFDYDLPNDTVYAETCASIGLIFFAKRMLELVPDAKYADVMERALYNNVIGSMAQDGKHYFYVNPLEVWPQACSCNPGKHHVKSERQGWFGCACCPPNVARLLTSLNQYIYTVHGDTLHTNLYIGSQLNVTLGGTEVALVQESQYPWKGEVTLKVSPAEAAEFGIALRIPSWSRGMEITVNGGLVSDSVSEEQGYAVIRRLWSAGDVIRVSMPMEAYRVYAHPNLRADAQKTAIQRGPLVYCLESADNSEPLSSISLNEAGTLTETYDESLLGGAVVVEGTGFRVAQGGWTGGLYSREKAPLEAVKVTAVPYYLWGNRGSGEMKVWIPE